MSTVDVGKGPRYAENVGRVAVRDKRVAWDDGGHEGRQEVVDRLEALDKRLYETCVVADAVPVSAHHAVLYLVEDAPEPEGVAVVDLVEVVEVFHIKTDFVRGDSVYIGLDLPDGSLGVLPRVNSSDGTTDDALVLGLGVHDDGPMLPGPQLHKQHSHKLLFADTVGLHRDGLDFHD